MPSGWTPYATVVVVAALVAVVDGPEATVEATGRHGVTPARRVRVEALVRYRLAAWDIVMPAPLVAYWTAWNERDVNAVPRLLLAAVEREVEWNDPRDSLVGIVALEAAVRRLRAERPGYDFAIASEIDHHHDRLRYRWNTARGERVLMEGSDIVTLSRRTGLIVRVDGIVGHPTPTKRTASGIPAALRADPDAPPTGSEQPGRYGSG